jgi:hypothetical protein
MNCGRSFARPWRPVGRGCLLGRRILLGRRVILRLGIIRNRLLVILLKSRRVGLRRLFVCGRLLVSGLLIGRLRLLVGWLCSLHNLCSAIRAIQCFAPRTAILTVGHNITAKKNRRYIIGFVRKYQEIYSVCWTNNQFGVAM